MKILKWLNSTCPIRNWGFLALIGMVIYSQIDLHSEKQLTKHAMFFADQIAADANNLRAELELAEKGRCPSCNRDMKFLISLNSN